MKNPGTKGCFAGKSFTEFFFNILNYNYMNGIETIIKERREQVELHGFTPESDYATYTGSNRDALEEAAVAIMGDRHFWPDCMPRTLYVSIKEKCRKEQLGIAGAFIAAQIDLNDKDESE